MSPHEFIQTVLDAYQKATATGTHPKDVEKVFMIGKDADGDVYEVSIKKRGTE